MSSPRRTPLLRGLAGATIATFAALASHVWVGGSMPGPLGIAVPWVLSLMVCVLLAGRRLSLVRLSISVALSQALFHSLFVLGAITPAGGFAPHVHGAVFALSPGGGTPLIPEDGGMWLAHGSAALVTVVLLHRGERIVQTLLRLASRVADWLARAVTAVVTPIVAAIGVSWIVVTARRHRDPRLAALRRRGPPLGAI